MKQFLAAVLVAVLVIPSPVLAHGGRTDASGGHTDHSTGEYHYHHGYSAHQHPNGVCPYNFDDQTDHSSGTTSGNSSSSGSSSWVYVDSRFFEGFRYNEATDEWLSDDGEYYESSGELFDCYGFYYDYGCDVWYNEDGFIDEDFCVRDHSDGDFFYCDSCENLMFWYESDDPDFHAGDCLDLDAFEEYEGFDSSIRGNSEDYEWALVTNGYFSGHYYCERTGKWKSSDGTIYRDPALFYKSLGLLFDFDDNRWYDESGFVDESGSYHTFSDFDMYVCEECNQLIEENDSEDHFNSCPKSKQRDNSELILNIGLTLFALSPYLFFGIPMLFYGYRNRKNK